MPAYNAAIYLPKAIESILTQSFRDFEFIIVDDHSTDNSPQIIKQYAQRDHRIVTIRNRQNLNICGALNVGLTRARGKYIARMDADDWSYPNRLRQQVEYLESHPDVVILGGTLQVCDMDLRPISERRYATQDSQIRRDMFRHSPFCHAATMYVRELAIQAGGYDAALAGAEDYDFYFRIGRLGRFANLSVPLYQMRINPHGISVGGARKQQRLTLQIRMKAIKVYGYSMSPGDWLYYFAQRVATAIIPPKLAYGLFRRLRDRKISA